MFIFLDESGDLGFDFSKVKTTRKFVITALVCFSQAAERDFKKAIRRTLRKKVNRTKNKSRWVDELKGTGTSLEVKEFFLRQVQCQDWSIYAVALEQGAGERTSANQSGEEETLQLPGPVPYREAPDTAGDGQCPAGHRPE